MTLKNTLLNTGYFIDNQWLDLYLELVTKNKDTIKINTEKHHILQKAYFKNKNLKVNNTKANLVNLSYADHCKAHWYLYKCTTGVLKLSNETAFRRMVNNKFKFNIEAGLTEEEYLELQQMWIEIKNDESSEYFSIEAEQFIKEHYNVEGPVYCAKFLGRSRHSITEKATKLGLREKKLQWWTDDEVSFLVNNYTKLTDKQIAQQLNKAVGAVSGKRRQLGLTRTLADYAWTEEEYSFLKANYAKLGKVECAKVLKRTVGAVQSRASYLGLKEDGIAIYCPELAKRWPTINAAAKELKIAVNLITRVLTGIQAQTHNLHFIYDSNKIITGSFHTNWAARLKRHNRKTVKDKIQDQKQYRKQYRLQHKEEHNAANRAWRLKQKLKKEKL